MRFEILGPLRALDGGAELDLGGPRPQRVLASLIAVAPRPLSVTRLIDEVWGEQLPTTAPHVIRTYVCTLRKTLGSRIVSDGRHYRLDTTGDSVDATEFVDALDDARAAWPADPARTVSLLNAARELWRGRPFGDLGGGASVLEQRAVELEEQWVQSLELLIAAELELGHHELVIPRLEALTLAHPFRERLHENLMLALYRSSRQAEALRAGQDLRNRLAEELGIEPSIGIQSLEDRILVQDPGLDFVPNDPVLG
jgi:DNA-binding SARP family transcriptional activator